MLTPIPKPNKNPNQLEGYRHISLLPVISKVLEKIISKRFYRFASNKVNDNQYAFVPMLGIYIIYHQMEGTLKLNLEKKKHEVVISEEIEKAFYRVLMTGRLLELNDWKMQPQIIKIFKSFFTNRAMIVKIDGFLSF